MAGQLLLLCACMCVYVCVCVRARTHTDMLPCFHLLTFCLSRMRARAHTHGHTQVLEECYGGVEQPPDRQGAACELSLQVQS